ncbi:GNAT family N-acetyltransferase [Pacificimonas sp. WHA3]|uniref:GNAT family N-acetyltransferase n=1 Tax=Pacificimonas pallii TaxID=2827236 RepID=A0ABS6SGN6_9SPHN|nr:GNAT family N-acetyltransferase [Pacificimonas pallii]MBV7257584.1 GNAT family N-acetyltransferase [Pacificimonas pallii]
MPSADEDLMHIRPAQGAEDRDFIEILNPRLHSVIRAPAHSQADVIAFQERFTKGVLDDTRTPGATLIAISSKGHRLGYVHVGQGSDDVTGDPCAYVALLAITPAAEGRDIARTLMESAEAWAVDQGYRRIALDVFASNDRARRFYDRIGFAEESIRLAKRLERPPIDSQRP